MAIKTRVNSIEPITIQLYRDSVMYDPTGTTFGVVLQQGENNSTEATYLNTDTPTSKISESVAHAVVFTPATTTFHSTGEWRMYVKCTAAGSTYFWPSTGYISIDVIGEFK